jgi:hypothetical protein
MKDKNHLLISIEAVKAFDKIQKPSMIKVLKKLGMQGIYLNILKCVFNKPMANINLWTTAPRNGNLNAPPLAFHVWWSCKSTRYFLLSHCCSGYQGDIRNHSHLSLSKISLSWSVYKNTPERKVFSPDLLWLCMSQWDYSCIHSGRFQTTSVCKEAVESQSYG